MNRRFQYGVKHVYGVLNGFWGFHDDNNMIELDNNSVRDIQLEGGSILGSNR